MIFKIGDRVWCKEHDRYCITDYHIPCVVTAIDTLADKRRQLVIRLEVNAGVYTNDVDMDVNPDYFEHRRIENWRERIR